MPSTFAIKSEGSVYFEKMVVTPDLNGTIAGMAHEDGQFVAPLVGHDRFRCEQIFAGDHKSLNGVVDGDQFCSVGERGFHLDIVDHFRDAFHYIGAPQYGSA